MAKKKTRTLVLRNLPEEKPVPSDGMTIKCSYKELVDVRKLKPHPHNKKLRKHSQEAIERTAEVLQYQGWRAPIRVSNQSGFITVGHKRLSAAKLKGWKNVPVDFQDYEDETQEIADVIADNALHEWDLIDRAGVNELVGGMGPDFNIDLLGLKDFTIDVSDKLTDEEASLYTDKIQIPIYEPKGERPQVSELFDKKKTEELVAEIEALKGIPADLKEFLKLAAQRHTIFAYDKIAEYYCHASKEVQKLMEDSALVIIDFQRALENGFIRLTKAIADNFQDNEY